MQFRFLCKIILKPDKMKKTFLLTTLAALFALSGCDGDKRRDDAIMRFYLSQPRDPRLVGWWENERPAEDEFSYYTCFNADGTAYECSRDFNGKLWRNLVYWYSKDGVYHIFERPDSYVHWKGKAGSTESHIEYEVRGDELWTNRSGGWKPDGKRTAPQQ